MSSVDLTELDRLVDQWTKLLQDYPDMKQELLERIGKRMESTVRDSIRGTSMRNGGGRLPGWQTYHVGSKRGYAAVRAIGSNEGAAPGRNSPGAITNYTELGHKTRDAKTTSGRKQRRGRNKKAAVDGYHFYERAESQIEKIGQTEVPAFATEIANRLGGGS